MLIFRELDNSRDAEPAFRLLGEHRCVGCDRNNLATAIDMRPKAFRDDDDAIWCGDCMQAWHGDERHSDENTVLRLQGAPPAVCADCGDALNCRDYTVFWGEGYGSLHYCVPCTETWMQGQDDDAWDDDA